MIASVLIMCVVCGIRCVSVVFEMGCVDGVWWVCVRA